MGIFQMPRIIVHGNVYQRVGRKRQSGFVGCLYAKQTIESPVRPAEPPRVGNLAQCQDGAVRTTESITDSALERIPSIRSLNFPQDVRKPVKASANAKIRFRPISFCQSIYYSPVCEEQN